MGPFIDIVIRGEAHRGSTGAVHCGTRHLEEEPLRGVKVAVKFAFSEHEKYILLRELRLYSHLAAKLRGEGIPHVYGLFIDQEPVGNSQGPFVLVMKYTDFSYHDLQFWSHLPDNFQEAKYAKDRLGEHEYVISS